MMAKLAKRKKEKKPRLGSTPNMELNPSSTPFQSQARTWFFFLLQPSSFLCRKNWTKA